MTIRIVLADDHRMFREALKVPLTVENDIEIVAEAGSGAQALDCLDRSHPDVLILDIALPDMSGVEVARRAMLRHPKLRIVALSGYADRMFVAEMLKVGARAYVVKSSGADELVRAIRAVVDGHVFLSPDVTGPQVVNRDSGATSAPPLSVLGEREQEVLRLLANGRRSAEIAALLGISPATVHVHRRNIKKKLGVTSTADLTRYAIREGLQSL